MADHSQRVGGGRLYSWQLTGFLNKFLQKCYLLLHITLVGIRITNCDQILENLPCWHKTNFRLKQLKFSDIFQYQFLFHIFIKQLLSFLAVNFETYSSFLLGDTAVFIPPGRCAQKVGFPKSGHNFCFKLFFSLDRFSNGFIKFGCMREFGFQLFNYGGC